MAVMALLSLLMALMSVAMAAGAHAASEENELDYGYWNYREGGINSPFCLMLAVQSCKSLNCTG